MADFIRRVLADADLPFADFVELALYHPAEGYYARARNPIGPDGDYVTSSKISPVFAFALRNLIVELVERAGSGGVIVEAGCGDGSLLAAIHDQLPEEVRRGNTFVGLDRSLSRIADVTRARTDLTFVQNLQDIPAGTAHFVFSNELFDAFPFARLVQRGEELHELYVTLRDDALDWSEHEAQSVYGDYFARTGVTLADGQFADVSLEWAAFYGDLAGIVQRGAIVTIDYGFPRARLFHPRIRRFGTAAAFRGHQVSRDLLATPGEQDLTAHIDFTALMEKGEELGFATLAFERQARFLLSLDIASHELFKPVEEGSVESMADVVDLVDARDAARRLVLPDGIGEEMRVLVQARGIPLEGWSFQRKLF